MEIWGWSMLVEVGRRRPNQAQASHPPFLVLPSDWVTTERHRPTNRASSAANTASTRIIFDYSSPFISSRRTWDKESSCSGVQLRDSGGR